MRSRGIPDLINGMDHGIVSRIKANGKISPEQVVVDGTRYPNDRTTKLPGKDIRPAECAVTPTHDECIHLCGFQIITRSDARRGGKECVSTCRSWWSPLHKNTKT